MKVAKGAVLIVACLAVVISLAPLVAHSTILPQNQTGPGEADGGRTWKVTCQYDANDHFMGKTCTSGGPDSCACP